ncbi:protein of unknown function [Nitrospira japonica]|uniref:Uncharacterized protein n=1 Tax=Nitrospira japonica TaxID=1325564 RepID=A0A1W1I384_9BACT|nr:hypothetical protein [Nitrospira japonica]SLM47339.1 protein of unknown function [Nitrospira japonica]
MTLFSTLMARSGRSRRRADGFGSSESVPWDADSFPYHTVRRSIDLASMVPDGDRERVQPATVGKRTRARLSLSRRAIVFLCAAGGLGLVLLSLAHAARTQSSLSPERGRRNSTVRPARIGAAHPARFDDHPDRRIAATRRRSAPGAPPGSRITNPRYGDVASTDRPNRWDRFACSNPNDSSEDSHAAHIDSRSIKSQGLF